MRRSAPDFVLLGADSRIGMPAELVFKREPGALLFCTFVAHENSAAKAAWSAIERIHVPVVRSLRSGARERLQT